VREYCAQRRLTACGGESRARPAGTPAAAGVQQTARAARIIGGAAAPGSSNPRRSRRGVFTSVPPVASAPNTQRSESIRLYDAPRSGNEAAAAAPSMRCSATPRDPKAWASTTLDRRTLATAVRSALHFHVADVLVVSAYRKPVAAARAPHANGKAIDFRLPGSRRAPWSAYLRTLARAASASTRTRRRRSSPGRPRAQFSLDRRVSPRSIRGASGSIVTLPSPSAMRPTGARMICPRARILHRPGGVALGAPSDLRCSGDAG